MKLPFILIFFLIQSISVQAGIYLDSFQYHHGDTVLEGYLAYDASNRSKRPGVLIVHDSTGLGPYVKKRADALAKLGYVAMAIDMYGVDSRPASSNEASQRAAFLKSNRDLIRDRALVGLGVLTKHPLTDTKRLAAIGYSLGGTVVLELARSGAELRGVVSFYGDPHSPVPDETKKIKGKVLIFHGGQDPFVSEDKLDAFRREMETGEVDWQLVSYESAYHGFANPESGTDPSGGMAYHEEADLKSWVAMRRFFKKIF